MLTPADINNKEFGTTRLREGYDQGEVDDFLDGVAEQLKVTLTRLAAAEDRLKTLDRIVTDRPTTVIPVVTPSAPVPVSESVERILTLAQETADKHVAEAQAKGAELLADARAEISRLRNEAAATAIEVKNAAEAEVQRLKTEGVAEKQAVLDDLEARHGQVTAALGRLHDESSRVREALAGALSRFDTGGSP